MAKVLIVEDEAPIAHAYSIVLEQAGCEVVTAGEAKTALELVETEQPDLILLDIMMPEVNGLDLLKQLNAKPNHAPIIALSNIESRDVVDEAFKLGVVDFLRKVDFTPHQIVGVVKKHLTS